VPLIVPIGMCSKTAKVPSWVGAAHRADRDVFEDGEAAKLGGGGGDTGVAGGAEDQMAVVPEVERLGEVAVDVDVAVAVPAGLAGNGVDEKGMPEFGADEAVDFEVVGVLEHDHGGPGDLVPVAGIPERTQLGWGVRVAPAEATLRRVDRGGELGPRFLGHRDR